MANIQIALRTAAGTLTMPGGTGPLQMPFWGYGGVPAGPKFPGPVLQARAGDTLQVTLRNNLPQHCSVILPGQRYRPIPIVSAGGLLRSYDLHAEAGWVFTYPPLTLGRPGTFRYESGSNPAVQVQMGLAGVLIVRPADFDPGDPARQTAYGPGTGSEYDREALLILAELDSRLHAAVGAGQPFDLLQYMPDWWCVNGRAYPETLLPANPGSSQPLGAGIAAAAGERVLLRCVNLGFLTHALSLGGLAARVIAKDAHPLASPGLDRSYQRLVLTIAPGETYDLLLVPEDAGEYLVFDRELDRTLNEGRWPGGMMTRLVVAA